MRFLSVSLYVLAMIVASCGTPSPHQTAQGNSVQVDTISGERESSSQEIVLSCVREDADFEITVDYEISSTWKETVSFYFKNGISEDLKDSDKYANSALYNDFNMFSGSMGRGVRNISCRILDDQIEIKGHFCGPDEDSDTIDKQYLFQLSELPKHINEQNFKATIKREEGDYKAPEDHERISEINESDEKCSDRDTDADCDIDDAQLEEILVRWKNAWPENLVEFWIGIERVTRGIDEDGDHAEELRKTIEKQYPNEIKRALFLYHWLGSVEETWRDAYYPEIAAERPLLWIPLELRLKALDRKSITQTQIRGAVRFFVETDNGSNTMPPKYMRRLLSYCPKLNNEHNRNRCIATFDASKHKKVNVLDGFQFEQGGYAVLGMRWEQHHKIAQKLGDFYVDDIQILKKMQSKWVTGRPSPYFACGYHYGLSVVHNGKELASFSINMDDDCNTIVSEKWHHWFNPKLLLAFKKKHKKIQYTTKKFGSLEEGRAYIKSIADDPKLLMFHVHEWMEFDGYFTFKCPCNYKKENGWTDGERCLDEVKTEVRAAYPDEPFELDMRGLSEKEIFIRVRSHKSLYDKFKLFPTKMKGWTPYSPTLRVIWKSGKK